MQPSCVQDRRTRHRGCRQEESETIQFWYSDSNRAGGTFSLILHGPLQPIMQVNPRGREMIPSADSKAPACAPGPRVSPL
ncbi:hypothetical protein AV530_003964 [Patagioenas fasciata monilis]|uniref:Uncharacterized protein n=1 Tax=Patagioenas fasciata monilis TaxID=372326 RepID=A0A1V4JTH1_PATFA|nr:hypothetical protein AV530_003964 [Patagioenas fasciata monilis]